MKTSRSILKLAIPNIISNLSVPLLSTVDTALVGHLPHTYYIGAVAVGSMIFNFIYWGFGFLRMGTTGLTAQAYGRDDSIEEAAVLGRALLVALAGSLVVILMQIPIAVLSFALVDASAEVEQYARSYFLIRIYAAPATLSLYVLQGWFLGQQNAKYPMYMTIAANLLNLGFNLLFILGLGMNSDGVALGTVCAQYLGLVIGLFLLFNNYPHILKQIQLKAITNWQALRRFFALNSDIFIRTMILVFVYSFFTAKSAELGDDILAANTILIQLWMIFSYGIDGFAFAGESLVGRFIGARDLINLKKFTHALFFWGTGMGLAFSLIYFVFDEALISIFTNKNNIIALSLSFMGWTVAAPFLSTFGYIWDGVYLGATVSRPLRNAMLLGAVVFYLPAFYIGKDLWGNHGMWMAIILFTIFRGLSLTVLAKKHIFSPLTIETIK